ncbi:MAG: helix-hairpin-helix domain-containing protein [Lentimicrobiaceae bacterium]|nr:helix-hairpin-helix domain-containing protein [Lentimicrobiaceae bacterium]
MRKKSLRKRYLTILKNAFDFSTAEQRGIVVLCVILFLLIGYYFFLSRYYAEKQGLILTESAAVDSFLSQQQHYADSIYASRHNAYTQGKSYAKNINNQRFTPFDFCPDTMKVKDWVRLGFTEKQASQIEKFQSKGGKFFRKEDFKKLYCVSEETYCVLEPYIYIPAQEKQDEKRENPNVAPKHTHKLELNEADSMDLLKIPWIGEKTAAQIIAYRAKLGGFIHIDQLKEIKSINQERFAKIEPYLYADAAKITKININEATISMLVKHPYIEYYLAKSIVMQREQTGKYASLAEMGNILFIYDELYQKIAPYLTVE